MPTPPLDPVQAIEALQAAHDHETQLEAAKSLGVRYETFKARLRRGRDMFPDWAPKEVAVEALPPKELPFEERLEWIKRTNAQRIAHKQAMDWQRVHIPVAGPFGLCWFGDPHLDDPYADVTSFEHHAKLCAATEGMFGVNGGDTLNNWVGRLKALYADQPVTAEEGWELADWALNGLGVRWACWILGNHDVWEMGHRIFDKMNTRRVLMRDWEAKLTFVSPNKGECRAWIRHDFKGQSIYNELHGQKRAAMFTGGGADIYAAFHRHTFATGQFELDNNREATLIRARGYKDEDHYAMLHGFPSQRRGQSVVTIIEPHPGDQPNISVFKDVEEGCDFLEMKRRKAAA